MRLTFTVFALSVLPVLTFAAPAPLECPAGTKLSFRCQGVKDSKNSKAAEKAMNAAVVCTEVDGRHLILFSAPNSTAAPTERPLISDARGTVGEPLSFLTITQDRYVHRITYQAMSNPRLVSNGNFSVIDTSVRPRTTESRAVKCSMK